MDDHVHACRFSSPVGTLVLEATDRGLRSSCFARPGAAADVGKGSSLHAVLRSAVAQLEDYFAGKRDTFDVKLDLSAEPPFRRRVLRALAKRVPKGKVVSYAQLARMVGQPNAARAVGGAMAKNPLPIFIPCHRVVARNGLGGFGPGLRTKVRLLRHEDAVGPDGNLPF